MNARAPGHRVWLMPLIAVGFAVAVSLFFRDGNEPSNPPAGNPPVPTESAPAGAEPAASSAAERFAASRPTPTLGPPQEAPLAPPAITPELRQEREQLHAKLAEAKDPTLDAVTRAFELHGISQPDVLASGWILAQHWGIAARGEQLVEARIEDPVQRQELGEVRERILIGSAEAELKGLMGITPDPRLLSDLETIGRALRDNPPVAADLLPSRASARIPRDARPRRPTLPPEE